jgi:hypothetical protein
MARLLRLPPYIKLDLNSFYSLIVLTILKWEPNVDQFANGIWFHFLIRWQILCGNIFFEFPTDCQWKIRTVSVFDRIQVNPKIRTIFSNRKKTKRPSNNCHISPVDWEYFACLHRSKVNELLIIERFIHSLWSTNDYFVVSFGCMLTLPPAWIWMTRDNGLRFCLENANAFLDHICISFEPILILSDLVFLTLKKYGVKRQS